MYGDRDNARQKCFIIKFLSNFIKHDIATKV